jgi:hypothetical protein
MMRTYAARFGLFALGRKSRAAQEPCTMGVGCDETGVCYAGAMGEPERCPRVTALKAAFRETRGTVDPALNLEARRCGSCGDATSGCPQCTAPTNGGEA